MAMFLNAEKSQSSYPGPCAIFRPAVPNCCTEEFGFGVIRAKASALSQSLAECGPELGFWPATRSGRLAENPLISGAPPCADTSRESKSERRTAHCGYDSVELPCTQHLLIPTLWMLPEWKAPLIAEYKPVAGIEQRAATF